MRVFVFETSCSYLEVLYSFWKFPCQVLVWCFLKVAFEACCRDKPNFWKPPFLMK